MRRSVAVALVVVLSTLLVPHLAPAQPTAVTITQSSMFTPGDDDPFLGAAVLPLTIVEGTELIHVNMDVEAHSPVSDERVGPDNHPLFGGAPLINRGKYQPVPGVEDLPPGVYPFHCVNHSFMRGTLTVLAV